MAKLVTIFGGSGFIGRHVAWEMARRGWRVRVAVRRTNQALFVRTYGFVGQVTPVPCNIRDDLSVQAALHGADAVINCVGIMVRARKNTFDSVHEEGAARIARFAAEAGVGQLVHVSANGADAESDSRYAASKARGEAAVQAAFPDAVILRPSIVFGQGDTFYNRLAGITVMSPITPVICGRTRIQPVLVDDVAKAAAMAAEGAVGAGIYTLGGPDVVTMRQVAEQIVRITGRRRLLMPMPRWIAAIMAGGLDLVQFLSGGLITNSILTRDQLRLLSQPNIVPEGAPGFEAFGITPVATDPIIEDYLWRFRKYGQYAAISESARRLHGPDGNGA